MLLGERIKQARVSCGYSLRELASKAGVSAQAISKYERNIDTPGSDVLIRLADALEVPISYFFRSYNIILSKPVYRKRSAFRKKDAEVVESHIRDVLERYLEVQELLNPDANQQLVRDRSGPVNSLEDVEAAAENLRKHWQLGIDPINNLMETLEDRGVKIVTIDGFPAFDSCAYWANGHIPVIAVKNGLPGDRQRFNIAHELGHLFLSVASLLPKEKAANRFAGALLVPRTAVINELGSRRSNISQYELAALKVKYGISMQALIYRAKDIGIISENYFRTFMIQFRSYGYHKKEPGEQLAEECSFKFERMVVQAVSEDIISETRAAELLDIPVNQVKHIVAPYMERPVSK